MGQAIHDLEIAEKIVSDERLDFVIGSIHQTLGEKDFFYIDYKNMSMDEIYILLRKSLKDI